MPAERARVAVARDPVRRTGGAASPLSAHEPHELRVRAKRGERALATGVARRAVADLVEVQDDGALAIELVPVRADERAHALGERLLRAGQQHVHAEQLGIGALGEPQGEGDARRVVVLTLLDRRHRHVEQQRERQDQGDRRDELDDAQPGLLDAGEPDEAADQHEHERPEEGRERADRRQPPAPARRGGRARRGRCRGGRRAAASRARAGHPTRSRSASARRPSSRRVVTSVPLTSSSVSSTATSTSAAPSDGELDGQGAAHDRERGVDRVRELPGRPGVERLELRVPPECPQAAGQMAGGAPLGVGAGRPCAEAVDERLGLGERVDRHRSARG